MIAKRRHREFPPADDHPTVSAIAPLMCFAVTLTVVLLLRISNILGGTTARCVENDQFWYTATRGSWPLIAAFVLVLFLLFAWNAVIGFADWSQSTGTRVVVVANAVAILAALYVFIPLHDNASFQYHLRNGYYEGIKFRPFPISVTTENACKTMRRFAGRWRVVDRKIGHYGFDVPELWIELLRWGEVRGADSTWQTPYAGEWRPPFRWRHSDTLDWRYGSIYGDTFGGPWDFELRGDTLILTTPTDFNEWEKSTIWLRREHAATGSRPWLRVNGHDKREADRFRDLSAPVK